MTGPDPAFITSQDWADLSNLLTSLWLILGAALGFGGSILLAHGMIPSLVTTRDLPRDIGRKMRAPLYVVAAAFLVLGVYAITLFVSRFDVMTSIYNHGAQ